MELLFACKLQPANTKYALKTYPSSQCTHIHDQSATVCGPVHYPYLLQSGAGDPVGVEPPLGEALVQFLEQSGELGGAVQGQREAQLGTYVQGLTNFPLAAQLEQFTPNNTHLNHRKLLKLS